jgi:Na+-driven multidrug efflux pump
MGVVNVIFDYGLIFGNLGMPELGIGGAAIASVIAEFTSTLFFLFYLKKNIDLNKYGFTKIRLQFNVIKKTLNISIFMMIQYLFSVSTWMLFFLFIENYMGERSLAVSNVVRSLYTVVTIPSHAIGSATSTLVSNTIGGGRQNDVLNLVKRLSFMSLGVMVVMMLIIGVLPRLVVNVYTDDPILLNEIIAPLYVMLSSLPLYSIGTVLFSSISGTGNTRSALKIEIISLLFYVTYMWFIIVHLRSSVALAWTTEHVYWSLLIIIPFFYLRRGKWKEKKI